MSKSLVSKPVLTTLVIRDRKGRETGRHKVEVFLNPDGDFGVRILDGDWMKGLEATLPASAAAGALGKRGR